jgi:hypothetical protein
MSDRPRRGRHGEGGVIIFEMATRGEFLRRFAELVAVAEAARAAPKIRISHFEINSVRVPFHERVREAWLRSWEHQKRDQVDYVLHFVRLHRDEGLTGIGQTKSSRTQAEAKLALGNIELYRKLKERLALPVAEPVDNLDIEAWTREGLLDAWIVGAPRLGQRLKRLAELAAASRRPI